MDWSVALQTAFALLKAQEHEALNMPKPDSDIGCWYDITHNYTLEQVVNALKAQEPMVLTLEEYEAWLDTPFTERNPVFHEERTKRGSVTCWVNTGVCSLREYGKNDRCWTSRPSKEGMEATPWNAQGQRDYEAAVEMAEYCERYEPTYNAEDGSM